ncbi:hypothetical protein Jab_2c26110 [Janthinobacterium sp. HH01]|uniref:hypothetical protein n=1 Tax=Oxalobacteraceae TaxID=75682 RepID=UPI0002AEB439|nr:MULTISPECIES: hypothetical protein [Oxalobacteraceae]ELX10518.1 hypothetical protein Jab_2c26110 [Janthinobacterium sp. HH01]OEZ58578.1 hypothetical protein DUGA6_39890 [Duganella sp. HH105]
MSVIMGQDLPLERPDNTGRAALFVPTANIKDDVLETVRKGAAIVGFGNHDRTLTIYYESNRFNEANLTKWEQKARKAFERLAENLPTVSKMVSRPENFEQVGYISSKGILIRRMEKLMKWLETSDAMDSAPESETIVFAPPPPPKKIT